MADTLPERIEELRRQLRALASDAGRDSCAELLEASHRERDALAAKLAQEVADWAETDTAIRELCGHQDDGYMVPLVDVVKRAMGWRDATLAGFADYCRARIHPGVNPGAHAAFGEILKIAEGQ